MKRLVLVLSLLASAPALAVPMQLAHQGRLLDTSGDALEGAHTLDFTLYDAPAGGAVVWTESQPLELDNGFYATSFGAAPANPLEADDFSGDALYLAIAVDGAPELPDRIALRSVPFAVRAGSAGSVAGGVVDATEVKVGGATVIGTDGKIDFAAIENAPADLDTLGELSCAAGEIARFDGSAWGCASDADHSHHADDLTDGTLAVARLPVGTSGDTVAAGDHGHKVSDLTGDSLTLTGTLTVGDGSCDSTTEGAMAFTGDALNICSDGEWSTVWTKFLPGETEDNPALSCADAKKTGDRGDGRYWIDPTGAGAFQVECDMTTNGGGWTHIATISDAGSDVWSQFMPAQDTGLWQSTSTLGSAPTFTEDFKSQAYVTLDATSLLVKDGNKNVLSADDCWTKQSFQKFIAALQWRGDGSDSNWDDSTGAHRCAFEHFGYNDPVLRASTHAGSQKVIGFKWGERDGVQDGNKDRTMITGFLSNGSTHHVDLPTGLGGFTSYNSTQKHEDANECRGDGPEVCGANSNQDYSLWVR